MISVQNLPEEQKNFLLSLEAGKNETPVYYRDASGEVFFVADYVLTNNKVFEKTAPIGLYRGGALLKLLTKDGQVVIYDERSQWLRLVGGIARFDEGSDLTKTAIREAIIEELAVLADSEKARLVPVGMKSSASLLIPAWGITAERIEEVGLISEIKHYFNDANKAFEIVVQWDISDLDGLEIFHQEDWFRGGRSGFVPMVIDERGNVVGMYDGRHGYMSFPVKDLHPTLREVL